MKQHPRIRRVSLTVGVAGVVVLALVWLYSIAFFHGLSGTRGTVVYLVDGVFQVTHNGAFSRQDLPNTWSFNTYPYRSERRSLLAQWYPVAAIANDRSAWTVVIPLWVLMIPCIAIGVVAGIFERRARRRFATGHCAGCGYDLRQRGGAAISPCPECGAATLHPVPSSPPDSPL